MAQEAGDKLAMVRVRTDIPRGQRQAQILADIASGGVVRVIELAARFGVSTETVRRDLDQLSRDGLIDRTYGGGARSLAVEAGFDERHRKLSAERRGIAEACAQDIQPGEVLLVDAGSSTFHFAEAMARRDLPILVITNCLTIADVFGRAPRVRVMVCSGELNARQAALEGPDTIAYLSRLNADRAVIGASGLTMAGPTEAETGLAWVKRVMIERATRAELLVDHTKFNVRMLEIVCPLGDLDCVITDAAPDPALAAALASHEVSVRVAGR